MDYKSSNIFQIREAKEWLHRRIFILRLYNMGQKDIAEQKFEETEIGNFYFYKVQFNKLKFMIKWYDIFSANHLIESTRWFIW